MNKPAIGISGDWKFFVGWLIVNIVGGIVATVTAFLFLALLMFSPADVTAWMLIASLLSGGLLGTAQWLVLRTRLSWAVAWIVVTAVGAALGVPLLLKYPSALADVPEALVPLLSGLLLGATVGACQWFVLRKCSWSGLWVLASALVTAAVIPLVQLVDSIPFIGPLALLGYGVILLTHAAISGAVLLWLLKSPRAGTARRVSWFSPAFSLTLVAGVSLVIAVLWSQLLTHASLASGTEGSGPVVTPAPRPTPLAHAPGELVLIGHTDTIRSVVFSPDGRTVASASTDGTLKSWDAKTGRNIRTFSRAAAVLSVAFAPDGKTLAAGLNARDGQPNLKVWDSATGTELQSIAAHMAPVYSVAYSPDGKFLVTGSIDKTLKVWRVDNWQARATFSGHGDWVYSVAIAPDSATIASASWDHTVKLWDLNSGAARTLLGHSDKVMSVAFSPDGRMLASGAIDSKVKLWDVANGAEVRTLSGHQGAVNSVAFAPDGRTLASASDDRTVKLWDVRSGEVTQTLQGHSDNVTAVSFSPDGLSVVSGSADTTVRLRIINP